jgi:hypothetical protein
VSNRKLRAAVIGGGLGGCQSGMRCGIGGHQRHILRNAPLYPAVEDADRMVETMERTGAKLAIDHTHSYIPSYQVIRR